MSSIELIVLGDLVGSGIVIEVNSNWAVAKANSLITSELRQAFAGSSTAVPPLLLSTSVGGDPLEGGRTLASYGINESTPIYIRAVPAAGAYSHYLAALFAFNRLNN